jgi:isocitrate dehydrogenase (NAD+)
MTLANIIYISGDGIGPEVVKAAMRAMDAACQKHGRSINWIPAVAGKLAANDVRYNDPLPQETVGLIRQHGLCLKGPMETPLGRGYKSPNVRLRQALDLYACVRPIRNLPNVWSPLANSAGINLVIVRENTEDLYTGEEQQTPEGAIGIKRVTRKGCERIVRFAFEYAVRNGYTKVTAAAKPNIMKQTDGLFQHVAEEVGKEYGGKVESNFLIVDNCGARLITGPQSFGVLVTLNLYGDILSDMAAATVGGLGVAPGANIGDDCAVFEAVHGTAPDIPPTAGNPTALTLSGVMLLDHIALKTDDHAWSGAARELEDAVKATLTEGTVLTGDLLPRDQRHRAATSGQFADEVIRHIR